MNIEKILEDLYIIDPELKNYEFDIKNIVLELLKSKPNIKFDKKFAIKLKNNLTSDKREIKNSDINFVQKFVYVFIGATLCTILIIPLSYYVMNNKNSNNNFALGFIPHINTLKDKAFGNLSLQQEQVADVARDEVRVVTELGVRGGINNVTIPSPATKSMIMPSMDRISYNYVYNGDDFDIKDSRMDVFSRNKKFNLVVPDFLNSFDLGLLDLSKFENSMLQNFTIEENIEFGHVVNVNFQEGAVAIFENSKWSNLYSNSLKMSDIPSDEDILKIVDDFIKEKNINLDFYSKPYIDNTWKIYQQTDDKGEIYVPETMSVVYPMILNDKIVYDQGGIASGLIINVNIRYKKVASISNLKLQNYDKSLYDCETDKDKILQFVQNGGINSRQYYQSEESIDLNLDTPEQIYIYYYKYDNEENQELIVPALRFKVKKIDESNFAPQYIIVPLVKELLDNVGNDIITPILYRESGSR
ncbi:MAG: hypothetical protein PHZ07_04015 [Patescibacteria group bacterium]|nr:hypothetical protein [Patescibacteria group bacterium]MDD4304477.1 hypothetical protein [Patescibacteria group bacterium]MDD4694837.1 hypothetical protein [Patescibacteria group bacterium]